jgi:hypothetical protein
MCKVSELRGVVGLNQWVARPVGVATSDHPGDKLVLMNQRGYVMPIAEVRRFFNQVIAGTEYIGEAAIAEVNAELAVVRGALVEVDRTAFEEAVKEAGEYEVEL